MKKTTFILLVNLFFVFNLFAQNKNGLIDDLIGKWYVEKVSQDTFIFNKELVKVKTFEKGYLIIHIAFYDELYHRIDIESHDNETYETRIRTFVESHKTMMHSKIINFGEYFEQPYYYSISEKNEKRIVLTRYKPD